MHKIEGYTQVAEFDIYQFVYFDKLPYLNKIGERIVKLRLRYNYSIGYPK